MDTNEDQELWQQRRRRNRINRIKTGIILSIIIWMIISMLCLVILSVQVVQLRHEIDRISGESGSGDIRTFPTEAPDQESVETQQEMDRSMINAADNLAGKSDLHKVYLTFDGSPSANTGRILEILKKHGVKATFFVSGDSSQEMQPVYSQIVEEGHTLGMHSYSNRYSQVYASREAFESDFVQISDYIEQLTGESSRFYRFPGGSCNQTSNVPMEDFIRVLKAHDITYFDWNVSAGDAGIGYTAEDVIDHVMSGVSRYKTSVVLLHDGEDKSTTVEALGPLIEALQKMGAEILPIDDHTKVIQYINADSVEEK